MSVHCITTKNSWNAFLDHVPHHVSFMQSWEWGEFKRTQGEPPLRVVVEEQGKPILGGQFLEITIPLIHKTKLYCPFGPLMITENPESLEELLAYLSQYAAQHQGLIIDVELPSIASQTSAPLVLAKNHFHRTPFTIQPRCTSILDLTQTEEQLLASCKPKTRYNIRLAQKKGVEVTILEKPNWIGFKELLKQTATRNQVTFYPDQYFEQMGTELVPARMLTMLQAHYQQKLVASLFLVFFRKTGTYLFGASADVYRNTMANYLLHWEAIKYAQQRGCVRYDFWGIADGTKYTKGWDNITRFKQGFGGKDLEYPGLFRLNFNPFLYSLYSGYQSLRHYMLNLKKIGKKRTPQ